MEDNFESAVKNLDEAVKTEIRLNSKSQQNCYFARFTKTLEICTINRNTKQPIAAKNLGEVTMWDEHRLSDALKYQGWANKFINQIEIIKGTLTLEGSEVIKEPELVKIKVKEGID